MANNAVDQYSGDPRIIVGPNGATIKFIGGQPVMDGGFENAILISLFSDEWFANIFLPVESRLKSRFEKAHEVPITKTSLVDISNAGKKDLEWMLNDGIFSRIDVVTTNPYGNTWKTVFDLWLFDDTFIRIETTKNGQNWLYQMLMPANERIN